MAYGDSVFKVFASSKTHCGKSAHNAEVDALRQFGGYDGDAIITPQLKSHHVFHSPFEILGKDYVGFIEQSRLMGIHPNPKTSFQIADIGNALGELHKLFDERGGEDLFSRNIIDQRIRILKDPKARGHFVLPGLRKRVAAQASPIAADHDRHRLVHGDFHMGNMSFNGSRYGIYDLATVGRSVPEQDMIFTADKPDGLRQLFEGYARYQQKMPSKNRVMALYGLDLAIAADIADRTGRPDHAKHFTNTLQAIMS